MHAHCISSPFQNKLLFSMMFPSLFKRHLTVLWKFFYLCFLSQSSASLTCLIITVLKIEPFHKSLCTHQWSILDSLNLNLKTDIQCLLKGYGLKTSVPNSWLTDIIICEHQVPFLEQWSELETEHCSCLGRGTAALRAASSFVPTGGNITVSFKC